MPLKQIREDKSHKRSSVRLAIRELTYAHETRAPQSVIEVHKDLMMSLSRSHLECALDKEVRPFLSFDKRIFIALDVL